MKNVRIGDLVNFYTGAWLFEVANSRYINPGIVLEDISSNRYMIMWSDGKVTTEHISYIKRASIE